MPGDPTQEEVDSYVWIFDVHFVSPLSGGGSTNAPLYPLVDSEKPPKAKNIYIQALPGKRLETMEKRGTHSLRENPSALSHSPKTRTHKAPPTHTPKN